LSATKGPTGDISMRFYGALVLVTFIGLGLSVPAYSSESSQGFFCEYYWGKELVKKKKAYYAEDDDVLDVDFSIYQENETQLARIKRYQFIVQQAYGEGTARLIEVDRSQVKDLGDGHYELDSLNDSNIIKIIKLTKSGESFYFQDINLTVYCQIRS
jgi:hypothetical protein